MNPPMVAEQVNKSNQQQRPRVEKNQRNNVPARTDQEKPAKTAPSVPQPTEDEKRTKDLLNNIWNSLKANPGNVPPPCLPLPQASTAGKEPPQPTQGLDLTETLKKCLKISPVGEEGKTDNVPEPDKATTTTIQQPAPAQLPPPPVNWRIEAQIQHLSQTKGQSAAAAQPRPPHPPAPQGVQMPFMGAGGPPPPNQPMFYVGMAPMGMIPPPHMLPGGPPMGFPPHGAVHQFPPREQHPPRGPIVPGFVRPVPAMPFNNHPGQQQQHRPPFSHVPPRGANRHFFNNNNHGRNVNAPFFPNQSQQEEPNRLAGPHALRNPGSAVSSGHGAFIPLQAARKITKLKNSSGANNPAEKAAEKSEEPNKTEEPVVPTSSTANNTEEPTAKKTNKDAPKKAAGNSKPKTNPTPRPARMARIAANFSVNE